MAKHKFSALFEPQSIAIVGASERLGSLGRAVWTQVQQGSYKGAVFPVNPKHTALYGQPCFSRMTALPQRVDLALITAPAAACPGIIRECGRNGCGIALVLSSGFGEEDGPLAQALINAARAARVRILGPNVRGILRPRIGLDASAMRGELPAAGTLAMLSQSGAWLSILRDFAAGTSIGFSALVSLGESLDVDFGELLDFFAFDGYTQDVLLYIESIKHAPSFMSGLRQLARMKAVVVLKAGHGDGPKQGDGTHATALARQDRIFDAAIARAGAVRVETSMQMVGLARLLTSARGRSQTRVVAVTNGSGPGRVALDAMVRRGQTGSTFSEKTLKTLSKKLPAHALVDGSLIDIAGDATPVRYRVALEAALADSQVDVCLVLFSPQAIMTADELAGVLIELQQAHPGKTLLTVLGGAATVLAARQRLDLARIPQFISAENAVDAIGFLETFRRNQSLLRQVPAQSADAFKPKLDVAAEIFERVWNDGRQQLNAHEAQQVLNAFGIPVVNTGLARTPTEAVTLAESIGYPVVLKVVSDDIFHKTAVGGVQLDLRDARAVRRAAAAIFAEVANHAPQAKVLGLSVQRFIRQRAQRELYLGVATDATFGTVIGFGAGGISVEQMDDVAFELPPLNEVLTDNLIARTRVSRLLEAYSNVPAVNREALNTLLLRFSTLACMCPEIAACDLNPVVAYEQGVMALDARIVLRSRADLKRIQNRGRYGHLAVYPYPRELEERVKLHDGSGLLIRPIQPEDAEREREFVARLSPETLYMRFMMTVRELSPAMIERFTQIDYGRELALVGLSGKGAAQRIEGVARITPTALPELCEFAIVVGENMRGSGLAQLMMVRLFDAARGRGYREMEGIVLRDNPGMLKFCEKLGFTIEPNPDDPGERIARKILIG